MARKGNRQKNGLNLHSPNNKTVVSDPTLSPLTAQQDRCGVNDEAVGLCEELPNDSNSMASTKRINDTNQVQDELSGKKSREPPKRDRKSMVEKIIRKDVPHGHNTEVKKNDPPTTQASNIGAGSELPHISSSNNMNGIDNISDGQYSGSVENIEFPETMVFKFMRTAAFCLARSSAYWVERHKPTFISLKSNALKASDYVWMKIQKARPIIFRQIMHIGSIILLVFMVWLDCALRGTVSFLHMGTTSFFSILWCSILSVIAMVGVGKFLLTMAVSAAVGLIVGFLPAVILSGIVGMIFLWCYGSFWITGLVILIGGVTFITSHDRIALFITTAFAIYCAWYYVGWLGLVLGMNLSFISSDVLLYFLRNVINEQGAPNSTSEHTAGVQGQSPFSHNESVHASTGATGVQPERGQGMPSTSGNDPEITSEEEVARLLNCSDHYAALGLSRFQNIDVSVIKREYRKKAILVHPDKNMGNERAADAFKKLQNAYEVLLDSIKRKEYDDELRRDELLNYFRKFQNASHRSKGHGSFKPSSAHPEADGVDLLGESRYIACRKCGLFHLWVSTKRTKFRARWCQECKDFHQAKDGDGWVEQSSKSLLFGILQQVETPSAYVCADGKIYDATEWYICQGMRCPPNTHRPTFHVNTSIVSKNSRAKGTSFGQRGGGPSHNMEETMTEEELYEWLRNVSQSENFEGSTSETPTGFNPRSSGSNSKRKKKGKKQW